MRRDEMRCDVTVLTAAVIANDGLHIRNEIVRLQIHAVKRCRIGFAKTKRDVG